MNSTKEFSISVWINSSMTSGYNYNRIIGAEESGGTDGIDLQFTASNNLAFNLRNSSFNAAAGENQTSFITNNNWYHVVVVFNGDSSKNEQKLKMYIDGNEVPMSYNNSIPPMTPTTNHPLWIGGINPDATAKPWDGIIDDIRIYNKALSECEITSLFNEDDQKLKVTVQDTLNIYLSQIITTVYDASSAATTVKVYPNPTDKNLTVSIDNPSNLTGVTLKVMDALSSEVHNELITGSTQSIDVSTWTAGIYFLHILDGEKTIDIRKIVVNK